MNEDQASTSKLEDAELVDMADPPEPIAKIQKPLNVITNS